MPRRAWELPSRAWAQRNMMMSCNGATSCSIACKYHLLSQFMGRQLHYIPLTPGLIVVLTCLLACKGVHQSMVSTCCKSPMVTRVSPRTISTHQRLTSWELSLESICKGVRFCLSSALSTASSSSCAKPNNASPASRRFWAYLNR